MQNKRHNSMKKNGDHECDNKTGEKKEEKRV